jgi:transposase-like protein
MKKVITVVCPYCEHENRLEVEFYRFKKDNGTYKAMFKCVNNNPDRWWVCQQEFVVEMKLHVTIEVTDVWTLNAAPTIRPLENAQ